MLIAFREWRRTRPFWGGLLIVCGAGEILSTTVVSLGPTFRVGLGGVNAFVGVIITAVLGLCGLLLWFSPGQRTFYSIVAVILALATFNTINYGGFFLGLLLGVVGGAMAFAWSSAPAPERGEPHMQDAPPSGSVLHRLVRGWFWRQGQLRKVLARQDQTRNGETTEQTQNAGTGGRDRVLTIVTVPLAGLLLLAPAVQAQRAGGSHGPAGGCILIILCPPTRSPTPSPSPTPTTPTPSHQPSPTPRTAPPVRSQSPSTTPSAPGRTGRGKGRVKRTATPLGLMAPDVPAVLAAGLARLKGLAYDGVTDVPQPSGGSLPMMKFTLRSLTLTGNPTLTVHQNGSVATTGMSLLSFSGNVVLYATRLTGDLLGVPVTITPSSPLPRVERLLRSLTQGMTTTMTHVVTGQPILTAATSHWDNFHTTVG